MLHHYNVQTKFNIKQTLQYAPGDQIQKDPCILTISHMMQIAETLHLSK